MNRNRIFAVGIAITCFIAWNLTGLVKKDTPQVALGASPSHITITTPMSTVRATINQTIDEVIDAKAIASNAYLMATGNAGNIAIVSNMLVSVGTSVAGLSSTQLVLRAEVTGLSSTQIVLRAAVTGLASTQSVAWARIAALRTSSTNWDSVARLRVRELLATNGIVSGVSTAFPTNRMFWASGDKTLTWDEGESGWLLAGDTKIDLDGNRYEWVEEAWYDDGAYDVLPWPLPYVGVGTLLGSSISWIPPEGFHGSAAEMTDIPADQLVGAVASMLAFFDGDSVTNYFRTISNEFQFISGVVTNRLVIK